MAVINGIPNFFKYISVLDAVTILVLLALYCVFAAVKGFRAKTVSKLHIIFLSGFLWCFVSFFLTPFSFGDSFYHQRYILTAVSFILGTLPCIFADTVRAMAIKSQTALRTIVITACALVILSIALDYPIRIRRLANDTQNIDDVQVQEGLFLSKIKNSDTVWVVDAGATRFFGKGIYVDLMGLNTYELLTGQKKQYLKKHPPDYIQLIPTWNDIQAEVRADAKTIINSPTTKYTVTPVKKMKNHYLLKCEGDKVKPGNIINAYGIKFPFECAAH
jgi:hypothetical protein